MAKVNNPLHHDFSSLECPIILTMRDINTIAFDEASFYFCDPAFEKPLPRASRNTIGGGRSMERVPSKISLMRADPNPVNETRDFPGREQSHYLDPDICVEDFAAEDESTCGTLDYSVDTCDDHKITNVQHELTEIMCSSIGTKSLLLLPRASNVMMDDDMMNDYVDELDVHIKKKEAECFGIPMGWFIEFLRILTR